MQLKRAGSQPSQKGPAEYFTGTVRIDPLNAPPAPARVSCASVTFEPLRACRDAAFLRYRRRKRTVVGARFWPHWDVRDRPKSTAQAEVPAAHDAAMLSRVLTHATWGNIECVIHSAGGSTVWSWC